MGISTKVFSLLNDVAKSEDFVNFEIQCSDGSKKGDGFLSDITGVQIIGEKRLENGELENHQLDLVCKVSFPDASQREQFKCNLVFERETIFYSEVAPELLKFQRDRGLSAKEMFTAFPKCYKAIFDPDHELCVIILDDMRARGFSMWPKGKVSKIENTRRIIRELAKLHAVSFAMRDQCSDQFEKFEKLASVWPTFFGNGAIYKIYYQSIERCIELVENPEHKRIFSLMLPRLQEYCYSCSDDTIPNKFRALSHGDAWNNNILMRFNSVSTMVINTEIVQSK